MYFERPLKSYIFNNFICCTFVEKLIGLKCGHNGSLVEREQTLFSLLLARSLWFSVHTSVAAFFSWSSKVTVLLEPLTTRKEKKTGERHNFLRTDVQPTEHCKSMVVSGRH